MPEVGGCTDLRAVLVQAKGHGIGLLPPARRCLACRHEASQGFGLFLPCTVQGTEPSNGAVLQGLRLATQVR